jgi:hypothetical protein
LQDWRRLRHASVVSQVGGGPPGHPSHPEVRSPSLWAVPARDSDGGARPGQVGYCFVEYLVGGTEDRVSTHDGVWMRVTSFLALCLYTRATAPTTDSNQCRMIDRYQRTQARAHASATADSAAATARRAHSEWSRWARQPAAGARAAEAGGRTTRMAMPVWRGLFLHSTCRTCAVKLSGPGQAEWARWLAAAPAGPPDRRSLPGLGGTPMRAQAGPSPTVTRGLRLVRVGPRIRRAQAVTVPFSTDAIMMPGLG